MQPPFDSSQWTGDLEQALSGGSRQTSRLGQPYFPPHLANARPLYDADQIRAMGHAALLTLSPILLWLSGLFVRIATPDFSLETNPATSFWPVPILVGIVLWKVAEKGILPSLCRWFALAGSIAVLLVTILYAVAGVYAHAHAAAGPEMRTQISNIETDGGRNFPTTFTTFTLQDGAVVTTSDYDGLEYGSWGRCLSVRRLTGPFGFSWLRITEAAPLPPKPGAGQLAWPVEPVSRAECFSEKPLSALRGTT